MSKVKYKDWTRIPWDGNTALGYECYRKSFGRGHVSVGIGNFQLIVYSYGNNSDDSLSSTRRRADGAITEEDAMKMVDACGGKSMSQREMVALGIELPKVRQLGMTYEEFLFSQIYTSRTEGHQEYDVLYDEIMVHYALFKQSKYDVATKGLYECIQDYLNEEVNNQ